MKGEYLDQLDRWFHEEVEGFKAKGASEKILKEDGFTNLLFETVFKRHINEIRSDPAFLEEIILGPQGKRRRTSLLAELCLLQPWRLQIDNDLAPEF